MTSRESATSSKSSTVATGLTKSALSGGLSPARAIGVATRRSSAPSRKKTTIWGDVSRRSWPVRMASLLARISLDSASGVPIVIVRPTSSFVSVTTRADPSRRR